MNKCSLCLEHRVTITITVITCVTRTWIHRNRDLVETHSSCLHFQSVHMPEFYYSGDIQVFLFFISMLL